MFCVAILQRENIEIFQINTYFSIVKEQILLILLYFFIKIRESFYSFVSKNKSTTPLLSYKSSIDYFK